MTAHDTTPARLPAPPAAAVATSLAARLRWAVADGWTLTVRALDHWRGSPGAVIGGLLFPVLVVVMMGYLFGGQMDVPGGGSYREFIMPGMFVMTMLFGLETTFAAVAADASRGVTDRLRALPAARSALVTGRAAADLLHGAAALAVMVVCGLAVGWRWHDGAGRALAAAGLLLLLRFALVWVGILLALTAKGPESIVAVQILVWPAIFFSSALAAPATMPAWLGAVAEWNPLSATVTACRDLFGGAGAAADGGFAVQHATALAVAWPLVLTAVFAPLAVRVATRRDR